MSLRIGILTTSFPRYDGDAAGPFVLRLAQSLVERGHATEVLAPEPAAGTTPRFGAVDVRWVPYLRPRTLQRTFYEGGAPDRASRDLLAWPGFAAFPAALLLAALKQRNRWDALISHWGVPCGLTAAAVRQDRPHLAVFHSADVWLLRRLPAQVTNAVVRGATATWFVTQDAADEINQRAASARPTLVAPMATDEPSGPLTTVRTIHRDEPLRVLFLGRLVRIKGVDIAIQAAATRPTEISLVVAGAGPERERLEAGAPNNVRFVGSVDRAQREELFRNADVLVVPSRELASGRTEGVPAVAIEAAAHGLPLIATRTGGLRSLAACAELVPPDDVSALRRALLDLRRHVERRAQLRSRGLSFSERHRWSARAGEVERLLRAG